jgi:hypothetical protein
MITKCDWCPDNTCTDYWVLVIFGEERHRICNCCYKALRKETKEERDEEMKKWEREKQGDSNPNGRFSCR